MRRARQDSETDIGMSGMEWRSQCRHHGKRGRNCRDADVADETAFQCINFLPQTASIADDPSGPGEHSLPFRCKTAEPRPALHQKHAKRVFELLKPRRECGLADPTRFGSPPKVPFASQRNHEFQL